MNKKILFFLIIVILAIGACALGLVACDEPHEHSLTHTPAKEATCTGAGNIEYWYCEDCGKYFSDEAATTEVTQAETVIAATGHIYENHVCIKCGQADPNGTEGLEYELLDNDTYRVIGIGDATDTDIYIPSVYNGKAVTSIGDRAFSGNNNIRSVFVSNSVTSIGQYVFSNCSNLTSVIIPNSVVEIGVGLFSRANLAVIYCERSSAYSGWADYWNWNGDIGKYIPIVWNYQNNDVADDGNIYYIGENGIRYALCNGVAEIIIQSDEIEGEINIPAVITYKNISYSVTSIAHSAFWGCENLTGITIPNSITNIGYYAFWDCAALKSIVIPNSVTTIGLSAFAGCDNLCIYCEAENKPSGWNTRWNFSGNLVIWGYKYTFLDGIIYGIKDGEATVVRQGSTLSGNIIIHDQVKYDEAVYSVTSIGDYAFQGCSGLTSIKFNGTMAQWNTISKDKSWAPNTGDFSVICTDGTLKYKDGNLIS